MAPGRASMEAMQNLVRVLSVASLALIPACRTANAPVTAPDAAPANAPAYAPANAPAPEELPNLAEELLKRAAADQVVREELMAFLQEGPGAQPPLPLVMRMLATDAENTERLQEILDEHGWPTRALVGEEAAHAAWLLVQHADAAPEFQATVLALLEPLVASGEVGRGDVALLTDRVRVARGETQLFGTQYETRAEGGAVVLFQPVTPIENPERLDERRAAMGLGPHAEYLEQLREVLGVPSDLEVDGG